ncbi:putative alpha-L-fucosidase [Thozetella sp. PMI_491]|nr:putative alpha-L-fucosidase [Thozetella sp. PMI_491]
MPGGKSIRSNPEENSPITSEQSVPIKLDAYLNNKAFGSRPGEASLDALGQSFPAGPVGVNGIYTSTHSGVQFEFPGYQPNVSVDNVVCSGQQILVPEDNYMSASLLVTSDVRSTTVSGNLTVLYTDGSNSTSEVRAHAFWWFLAIRRGEITFPYFFTHNDTNHNASHIYEYTTLLNPGKTLKGVILPTTTNATTGRLHLFALSFYKGHAVHVQSLRPTQKWVSNASQVVELTVNNAGSECVSDVSVSLRAPGVTTVKGTSIKRICPGDQKRIDIAVEGRANGTVEVIMDISGHEKKQIMPEVVIGLRDWDPDSKNLVKHEVPQWYDDAKFGIFIHWGPYSVPGWGNSTPYEAYAEWFWWYSTRINESAAADRPGANAYRLRTFGPDLNYDDFFVNYTASAFDPKAWVDLFADAGARYFVFTTKHHDGFANFNTGVTTNRSALNYGPKRDILGELFEAAAQYQPQLRRGTYFSLPEWFNPDWGRYGFTQYDRVTSTSHPGIIARNPFTGLEEPYTGRIPVNDFIEDIMVPQMDILAYDYQTDIMWCDAGASNGTDKFAARWFNWARNTQNRQVVINDRCGSPWAADFDTPEYATFSTPQRRKWESNQGMDPFSYGFNLATPGELYMSASTIVYDLVDMISKNGNFLLDIGPKADGSIVQEEVDSLREAGTWIKSHEEAIFNTTYWAVTSEEGSLRFTQTNDAFYILSLEKPVVGRLDISTTLPILLGDRVSALGMSGEMELNWGYRCGGGIWLEITEEMIDSDKYCWVFKIEYVI